MARRLFLAPANILITEPGNLLTIPEGAYGEENQDGELDDAGDWLPARRARWAATLNGIFGFTVLPAEGSIEV